jgi:hypothetical protein
MTAIASAVSTHHDQDVAQRWAQQHDALNDCLNYASEIDDVRTRLIYQ